MGMVHKGGNAVPFHGDHHPVSIYVGDQPIFEPIDQAQDGKTLAFENTYNDTAEVSVFGESTQETLSGKNLLDVRNDYIHNIPHTFDNVELFSNNVYDIEELGLIDGEVYTFWASTDTSLAISVRDNDGLADVYLHEINPTATFTYDSSKHKKIFLQYRATGVECTVTEIQLEKGSTATAYEPYCGGIPAPNPSYPMPIVSRTSACVETSNADGSKASTTDLTPILDGRELRSLPDGTHDELLVHRDGTVELVLRCDASMFDPSYPVSSEWKLATPRIIQLPSIDPLPTYHPYTFVDGSGADISAHVKVFQ